MYNQKVLDAFAHPQNVGEIENPDGEGTVGNATCGDIMRITLRIVDDVIVDAKFQKKNELSREKFPPEHPLPTIRETDPNCPNCTPNRWKQPPRENP